MKEIDNTENTANYIGMSFSWLRQARVKGNGPPFIKVGRAVRYKKEQVEQWLNKNIRINTIKLAN